MHNRNPSSIPDHELQHPDRTSHSIGKLSEAGVRAVVEGLSYVPVEAIGEGVVYGLEASGELAVALIEVLAVGLEVSGELLGVIVEAIGAILGGLLSGL